LEDKPERENLEAWARTRRYQVFSEVLARRGLDVVVTAHNANDVAETLLMRLFANKELTTIEESDRRRRCLRPFLGVSREQIEEFVAEHRIPFVEDPSNRDTALVRNRIRRRILPLLEKDFDPSMVWILSERAQTVASDCEALQYVADGAADRIGAVSFNSRGWLDRCQKELSDLPYALKWRVVQALFTPIFGHTLGEVRARALLGLLEGASQVLDLGGGAVLETGKGIEGINLRS